MSPQTADRAVGNTWRAGRRSGTWLVLCVTKGLVEARGRTSDEGPAPGVGERFRFVLPAGTRALAR